MKSLFDNLKDSLGSFSNNNSQNNNSQNNNLSSLLGAGAVGGLLGALLGGSKTIRNVAKNVAVVGAGAAAATLAYKMLQKWKQNQSTQPENSQTPFASPEQNSPSSQALQTSEDSQALLVLQAMIFSARADGHIDDEERALIDKCSSQLGALNLQNEIQRFMNCPLDPKEIAKKVKSKEQAIDIYTLSSTIIYCDNFMEESYLNGLAQALNITNEEKKDLDAKAQNLRDSLKN